MTEKSKILVLETATDLKTINWNILCKRLDVEVFIEPLTDFEKHFKNNDIEDALIYAEPIVKSLIETIKPKLIIVHSKGVCLITYLVSKNIWKGKVLLLSPIPNSCKHLNVPFSQEIEEYDLQWEAVLKHLKLCKKVTIAIGNSVDEKVMIQDYVKEATKENDWILSLCDGDHDWPTNIENLDFICTLISNTITL